MMTFRLSTNFALFASLLGGMIAPVHAADNARTPISRERILSVLDSSGIHVTPDQMEQLTRVTASDPKPRLRVISVDVLDGESDKVRLQCEQPNTCLPFYVLVHWGQSGGEPSARSLRQDGRTTQPGLQPENMLVRSGKSAVLIFEGDFLRMTLPVTCLQNGGLGQQVRVLNKETRKTYLVRVAAPGVVTSVIPD
jgi:Chaperone for flagella basal body P-ring formation